MIAKNEASHAVTDTHIFESEILQPCNTDPHKTVQKFAEDTKTTRLKA
jgi:hypothetical protein